MIGTQLHPDPYGTECATASKCNVAVRKGFRDLVYAHMIANEVMWRPQFVSRPTEHPFRLTRVIW